jgi:hypothetical protein
MNPLSGVLGEAWQMYKAHARHLLAIAFVIYLAAAVIAALLALISSTVGAVLGSLVGIVAAFLLQATHRPGRDAGLLPALREFPGAFGPGRELRRVRADAVTEESGTRRAPCLIISPRPAAVVIWPPAPPTGRGRRT